MDRQIIITMEILLAIVLPLLFLYLKSNWSKRSIIFCSSLIPLFWYLTYAMIHELSHMLGTYLAGGWVTDFKLFPRLWPREFPPAWINSEGLTQTWQNLLCGSAPYIVDVICIGVGLFILRRRFITNAFIVGLIFMLLILRPTYEFMSELTGFLSTSWSDYNGIRSMIGNDLIWLYIIFSLALSLGSVLVILRRFVGFPEKKNI